MEPILENIQRAGTALTRGELAEAEALCRHVLEDHPDNVDALVLGCGIAARQGDAALALERIRRAASLAPERADCHNTMGQIHARLGQAGPAVKAFETALALSPDFAEARFNLGLALRTQNRIPEAAGHFKAAADLRPDWPEAHFHLANVLSVLGDWVGAVESYSRVLERVPDSVEALYNLGGSFQALGEMEKARDAYAAAISHRPDFAMALTNLGVVCKRLGEPDRALACYRRSLELEPDNPESHNNLGALLETRDETAAAVSHCKRAIELRPDFAEAYNNLGVALNGLRRWQEADAAFVRALELKPDFTEARFNLAVTRLLVGDFQTGWDAYECRFHRADWTHIHPHRYPLPRWRGEPFAGRRLYVHDEQGFGDTIQFVRYLPQVKALGGEVIFETRPALIPLLKEISGADRVVARPQRPEPALDCDLTVPLMSLPGIFPTDPTDVPADIPYLAPDPEQVRQWKETIGQTGYRVGLVWAGSPNHEQDRRRSVPPELFAPLARIADVRLFGLQKGGAKTAADSSFLQANLGEDFTDFADTAAAIANMDLVISVDTAAAHLAGAMGKEVWILLPYNPDWRWGTEGEKSGWYPQATLIRQESPGDWDSVVDRISRALERRLSPNPGNPARSGKVPGLREMFFQAASLHRSGRSDAAWSLCEQILALEPHHAETLNLAAVLAQERGDRRQAAAFMERAVAAAPNNAGLHRNQGRLLERGGDLIAAARAFQRAAELAPGDPAPALDLARTLAAAGRFGPAESVCRRVMNAGPIHIPALNLLGTILGRTGREDEAMAVFDRILETDPSSAEAWTNKGALFHSRGRLKQALAAFDKALACAPGHADARFNRGQLRLLTGDFIGGWQDYEARCEKPAWQRANPEISQQPRWRGEPLTDQSLFVCDEQGLGDTLQFVRYLPMVKERCERVVLVCAPPLAPLLAGAAGADAVTARGEKMPGEPGRAVSLLSLPGIFGTTEENIPADIPYLFADAEKIASWRKKMPGSGLRVGLVWSGNPGHANDRNRSCPLKNLTPILQIPGVTWFGLQKGEGARQIEELPEPLRFPNLGPDLADFSDTAAAMANLDLVVSVDTAVAHLAGGMGKPVWVLLPAVPDWRWLMERKDSPWYPSMRLCRQPETGGWNHVIEEIGRSLMERINGKKEQSGNEGINHFTEKRIPFLSQQIRQREKKEEPIASQTQNDEAEELFSIVEVETCSACNLRCRYCPNGFFDHRRPPANRLMAEDLFHKLIDGLAEMGFSGALHPHFFNEPLLDDRLEFLIEYARKRLAASSIRIFTNGTLLTPQRLVSLAAAGADVIDVTLHTAAAKKTEKAIMASLNKSRKGFPDVRFTQGIKPGRVIFDRGGLVPLHRILPSPKTCSWPSDHFTVDHQGNVVLCCNDYFSQVTFGNLINQSVSEIWRGKPYQRVRNLLLKDASKLSLCRKCQMGVY